VLVVGAHGVGKTFLARRAAEGLGLRNATASQRIRDERLSATWTETRQGTRADEYQIALARAVARNFDGGEQLLLDGWPHNSALSWRSSVPPVVMTSMLQPKHQPGLCRGSACSTAADPFARRRVPLQLEARAEAARGNRRIEEHGKGVNHSFEAGPLQARLRHEGPPLLGLDRLR
jgi:hypothetical protein